MKIRTFTIGAYQVNCYMVWGEGADNCILIDPGYEPEYILRQVEKEGKTVAAILLTHGHFDHVGGVRQIAADTGCKVYICREELSLPPMMTAGTLFYTDFYDEGDTLELSGLSLQVLRTPGHTPGSVCLICGNVIFSGDTLFAGSYGRTDFPGGNSSVMWQSLKRLAGLEGDFRVLPGHGDGTQLDEERRWI